MQCSIFVYMERGGYVYILTNHHHTVLYTGVTSDLLSRMIEHKNGLHEGFTKRYNVHKLVYFEIFMGIEDGIAREKQIKAGSRAKKLALIAKDNPDFKDLTSLLEDY